MKDFENYMRKAIEMEMKSACEAIVELQNKLEMSLIGKGIGYRMFIYLFLIKASEETIKTMKEVFKIDDETFEQFKEIVENNNFIGLQIDASRIQQNE